MPDRAGVGLRNVDMMVAGRRVLFDPWRFVASALSALQMAVVPCLALSYRHRLRLHPVGEFSSDPQATSGRAGSKPHLPGGSWTMCRRGPW